MAKSGGNGKAQRQFIPEPFPQSIHSNEEWEVIMHPAMQMLPPKKQKEGDILYKHVKVPKFWNPPFFKPDVRSFLGNYGERLMTPDEASIIGSHTKMVGGAKLKADKMSSQEYTDADGNEEKRTFKAKARNREMVDELETIFITIASYRDYRCPHTVESVFARATYPERIRVGIVDQLDLTTDTNCGKPKELCDLDPSQILCKYSNLIDVFEMNATLSVGPVFARHIGYRMYRGEYYTMQTDAHMEFINGWDVDLISHWKSAKNEMAVLTTYVSSVENHYDPKTGESNSLRRPLMCASDFVEDYYETNLDVLQHGQEPEMEPDDLVMPTLEPFWAAGFSFGRGHFGVQVPYDQYLPMIFQGEEITVGIRGFTYGYDFYAPQTGVIFHYYNNSAKKKAGGKKVAKFWENSDLYEGVGAESKARLAGIIQMLTNETRSWNSVDAKKYGIGGARTTQKFYDTFGIHIKEKKIEKHLCSFVGEKMQAQLIPHMRTNRMGINYDKVTYKFKNPRKDQDKESEDKEKSEDTDESEDEEAEELKDVEDEKAEEVEDVEDKEADDIKDEEGEDATWEDVSEGKLEEGIEEGK
eukprot:CAMPEP_0198258068 /NCGR_PEP_ID=MMETSP1447-20131203/7594_1 /TAXON_ID=420782 /ORGANISM="Chaetoceros dichaeta, Strain CCMP1751" /LENGTH=583 /DNA_ID=CAMNT_0043945113 /DNA_START=234 /DNA_END=1988 /DNA_ORIENTATION=+